MTIEAELFDGTVLEFPEGTDPGVIQRKVKELTTQKRGPQMPQTPQGVVTGPATPAFADGDARNPTPIPTPVTEDASLIDSIMGGAGYLAQEATRGVTNALGAPLDLVNMAPMALNLLPGVSGVRPMTDEAARMIDGQYPEQSIPAAGGGQNLYDIASTPRDLLQTIMGDEAGDTTTDNPYLRIAGRVANEVGAAALPVGGAMLAAGKMGVDGARRMGGPIGNFVESAAVNPVKFGQKELAVAAGAGAGAGTAREVASDNDPNTVTTGEALADFFGALAGGAATQFTGAAIGAGRDMLGAATGKGGTDRVKTAVAGTIGEAGGAPTVGPDGPLDTSGLAALVAGGKRVGDVVPGFRESTGDVLKNPGVQSLEYGRQSGPNTGHYAGRRTDNAAAVDEAITALAPDATPGAFREPLAAKRDAALLDATNTATKANADFETAAQALSATMTGEARGQTVRAAMEDALDKARTVEREAWSGVSGEVDPAPLAQTFDKITSGLTESEKRVVSAVTGAIGTPGKLSPDAPAGPTPTGVLDQFGRPVMKDAPEVSTMTDLSEITTLRSELQSQARQAAANGDSNQARIIQKYVEAIDGYMDGVPRLAEPLKAAREVSFDLNERFTRLGTPIADVLATRPSGGPMVPDSNVARRFVQPDEGQASNLDRIMREGGSSADVKAALTDEIKAGAQPLLQKPDQLDAYLKQYESAFEKFPELRAQLGSAAALKRNADAAATAKATTESTLGGVPGKAGTSPVAKYLAYGDERAVDAMSTVVNAKDPRAAVDEILSFAGSDPKAIEGARSAFWKLMERDAKSSGVSTRTGTGEQSWRPSSLYNFLRDPAKSAVAERLYADNPEHLANLKGIAEELRGVDLRTTAKAPNTSGTPQSLQGNQIAPSAESLGAYGFAYQRGQVGGPFIALRIASVMGRRAQMIGRGKQYQTLLDQALLNPDIAAMLMKDFNPANAAATARAAKAALGVRSAWVDELLVGSDTGEDDETVDTIMGEQ